MDTQTPAESLKPVESVKKLDLTMPVGVMPENFGQVTEMAQWISKGREMVPAHLRDNPAMCVGIIMDALEWGLNPFRLATQHFVVNGVGGYMAQAMVAAINRTSLIKGRLVPRYEGTGQDLKCILTPEALDGQVLPYESPMLKDINPKNSPLWKSDPQQQLFYYSARAWVRRYFPDRLMGAYDIEEARGMRDVTPGKNGDKPQVENMLNDEPVEVQGEVIPPKSPLAQALNREPTDQDIKDLTDNKPLFVTPEAQEAAEESFINSHDAEPVVEVPIEKQVENSLKYIRSETSKARLEEWQHENHAFINKLPQAFMLEVRHALDLRHNELSDF